MKLAAVALIALLMGWTGRDAAQTGRDADIARSHRLTAAIAATQAALANRVCAGATVDRAIQRTRT